MVHWFKHLSQTGKAALLMICAVFLFSVMDANAKLLTRDFHSLQVVWARYVFQIAFSFFLLAPQLSRLLRTNYIALQLIRSGFLFGATICFFFAISFMNLASATAVFQVAPLLMTFLAAIILREFVGWQRWLTVVFGLIGAILIIRPTAPSFALTDLLPLGAATFFAAYTISTRFLGREESPYTAFLYTGLIGTIIASFFVPAYWNTPELWQWGVMAALGLCAACGHFLLVRALSIGEASYLAPFSYVSLAFNALWGALFFAEIPDIYVWLGAMIIVASGLIVWRLETRSSARLAAQEALRESHF